MLEVCFQILQQTINKQKVGEKDNGKNSRISILKLIVGVYYTVLFLHTFESFHNTKF